MLEKMRTKCNESCVYISCGTWSLLGVELAEPNTSDKAFAVEYTNEAGDLAQMKSNLNKKMTFLKLYEGAYVPFTFAEFLGTDPVEETECKFSPAGSTITVKELFAGTVTANYGISDIYAIIKDASGKEVYRHAVRVKNGNTYELDMVRNSDNVDKWGTLDVSTGEFTVEVVAQLSTGERPTVYTGKIVP